MEGQKEYIFIHIIIQIIIPRLLFSYRLNGGKWSAPQRRTTLHLALPEGKYTFEVRAIDEFGNIDPTLAKTSFELTHCPGYDHPDENYSVGEKSKEPPPPSIHSKIGILIEASLQRIVRRW
jgi:hypothetical protein